MHLAISEADDKPERKQRGYLMPSKKLTIIATSFVALAAVGLAVSLKNETRRKNDAADAADGRPIQADISLPANQGVFELQISGDRQTFALWNTYENAIDLTELALSLSALSRNGDEKASMVLSRILNECAPLSSNSRYAELVKESAVRLPRQQMEIAIKHADTMRRRCENLVTATRITSFDTKEVESRWKGGIGHFSEARRLADFPDQFSKAEAKHAVAKVLASRDGDSIFAMADAMGYSDDSGSGILSKYSGGVVDRVAWKFVGCSFGASCSDSSTFVRSECLSGLNCVSGGFREYAKRYYLTPHQYELAVEMEKMIMDEIKSGMLEKSLNEKTSEK